MDGAMLSMSLIAHESKCAPNAGTALITRAIYNITFYAGTALVYPCYIQHYFLCWNSPSLSTLYTALLYTLEQP